MNRAGRTVILTALQQEARAVARALRLRRLEEGLYAGRGDEVILVVIGIGARRVPRLLCLDASRVIVPGLAGGLDPSLASGAVVVAVCPAKIHTSQRLVCTPQEKATLFGATGASCVDMETAVVRETLNGSGVEVIGVRSIVDTAHQSLSREVLALTDVNGRVKPLAVLGLLLRRPSALPELMRLRRQTKASLRALGEAVRQLIEKQVTSA
jgi:nucleoside phosphorylase